MNKNTQILLVDDDPAILEMLAAMLRGEGYDVLESATGEDGLQLARERRPGLVVLDVMLPGMSGVEVCRRIKSDPALPDVFVMLISGAATASEHKVEGLVVGADDYVAKPMDLEEFLARVRAILRLRDTTAALRASELHYRRLIEILPDAVAFVDLHGCLTAANPQALSLLGCADVAELTGRSALELIRKEDHERARRDLATVIESGVIRNAEYLLTRKSGDSIPVELSVTLLRSVHGQPSGLLVAGREITQRKRSEEILRSSEERFRQLAENIREVFWMTDLEKNRMIYISPGYEAVWGRSCYSLYESPRNWIEAIHPDDRQRVMEAALTKQVSGLYDEVYRIARPDGSVRWIHDRAFPIRKEGGEVYRVVGIAEDITARKRAEEALRESEARKGAITEAVLDAIITIDHKGRVLDFNAAAERMFGYPHARVIGMEASELLIPPSLREWFRMGLAHYFRGEDGPLLGSRIEITGQRAHRVEFPAEFSITRIELEGPPMFTAFFRDLTSRKRIEARLTTLAHAIESTTEPISIMDLHERFTFVNRAFQETFGYTEQEMRDKRPGFLFGPSNRPELFDEIMEHTRAGGWRGELFQRRKDGTEAPVFLSTSQIKEPGGRLIGFLRVAQDISERKRAEKQIRLLADAVQSTQEIICITDVENRITFVNRAFLESYGYREDEVYGKTPELLQAAKDPDGVCREIYQQTLSGGWRGELLNRRKDGSEFSVSLTTSQIKSGDGKTIGLMGVARDITERKRVEHVLHVAQERFTLFMRHLPGAAWMKDTEGRYLYVNETAERIFRTKLKDLLGKTDDDLFPPETAAQFKENDRSALRTGECLHAIETLEQEDGLHFSTVHKFPILGTDRSPIMVGGLSFDITERLRVEKALEESQRLRKAILDNISDPAWLKDAKGHFLAANEPFARFFGQPLEKIIGKTIFDLAPSEAAPLSRDDHEIIRSGKRAVFEEMVSGAQGAMQCFEAAKSPVFDAHGKVVGIVGIAHNITERKRAEEEMRQLPGRIIEAQENERLRVARELHDSVNQVIASAKMRLRKVEDMVAEANPAAREILARCHQLLVQALEENRRIAQNLRPSDLDEFGLMIACRNLCQDFEVRTNLEVRSYFSRFSHRLPPAVELNLFRIVQEAFNNIEKHARAGIVRLRITRRNGAVSLRVQDDGRGFDPESVKAGRGKGRGIGMTNIRERAAVLGGTCEVNSVRGRGTLIAVHVPCDQAP